MPKKTKTDGLDLASALGADKGVATQCFSIYIPNKDAEGKEIGTQRKWVLEAIRLLSEINGGATALPAAEGCWLNEEGEFVWENPIVVYSYIEPDRFAGNMERIREFLHRMGRETSQGEIAFEFENRFYRMRRFDPAKE